MKYTHKETENVRKNSNLTTKEDIPKNSAIPPQTPIKDLSVDDFVNFLKIISPFIGVSKNNF